MQKIPFYKYHGTGNDFIIIDNMDGKLLSPLNTEKVASLCHRRFGIGADGLMVLEPSKSEDFKMVYFNSDGKLSSMCGNGGRCISRLYFKNHGTQNGCSFEAVDGVHKASLIDDVIHLKMQDVGFVNQIDANTFELNTGSPHYVHFVQDSSELSEIYSFGRKIRFSDNYKDQGINVNLVVSSPSGIQMATYERGVEDETYSCGTGVVAASIANALKHSQTNTTKVITKGGNLSVSFNVQGSKFTDIILSGPAELVFMGEIDL